MLLLGLGMVGFLWLSLFIPGSERLPNRPTAPADALAIAVSMATFVSLLVVGAILAIRRSHNAIGWLLLVSGVCLISGTFGPEYVATSVVLGADLPGYQIADWLGYSFQNLGFAILAIWIPLLFPEGRLPGPRWRFVAWVAAGTMTTAFVAGLATDHPTMGRLLPNPVTLGDPAADAVSFLLDASAPVLVGCIALAVVSALVRFRKSRSVEREQLKWFLSAVAAVVVATFTLAVTQADWAFFALLGALALVPAAVGVAVLRYRLYEIDRLISRTIGWALVTGFLAAVFVGLIVGLQALLGSLTGGNVLAVAGSTLVVAALAQRLRSPIQAAVDRRFDRSRFDGERLLDAFSERLRDEVDLATINESVLATADAAVRPSRMEIWLPDRPATGP